MASKDSWGMAYKSLGPSVKKGILTEHMAYELPKYGIPHTNPASMPYAPLLLGMGVVFNTLRHFPMHHHGEGSRPPSKMFT